MVTHCLILELRDFFFDDMWGFTGVLFTNLSKDRRAYISATSGKECLQIEMCTLNVTITLRGRYDVRLRTDFASNYKRDCYAEAFYKTTKAEFTRRLRCYPP